jgi:hypothetical protein
MLVMSATADTRRGTACLPPGRDGGIRTRDPRLPKPVLTNHLACRYSRICVLSWGFMSQLSSKQLVVLRPRAACARPESVCASPRSSQGSLQWKTTTPTTREGWPHDPRAFGRLKVAALGSQCVDQQPPTAPGSQRQRLRQPRRPSRLNRPAGGLGQTLHLDPDDAAHARSVGPRPRSNGRAGPAWDAGHAMSAHALCRRAVDRGRR